VGRVTGIKGYVILAKELSNNASSTDRVYLGVYGSSGGQEWALPRDQNNRYVGGWFHFGESDGPPIDVEFDIEPPLPYVHIRKDGNDGILIEEAMVHIAHEGSSDVVRYYSPNVEPIWLDSTRGNGQRMWFRRPRPEISSVVMEISGSVQLASGKNTATKDPLYLGFMSAYGGREWAVGQRDLHQPDPRSLGFGAGRRTWGSPYMGGLGIEAAEHDESTIWYVRKDGTDAAKLEHASAEVDVGESLVLPPSNGGHLPAVNNGGAKFWMSEDGAPLVAMSRRAWPASRPVELTLSLDVGQYNGSSDPIYLGVVGRSGGREFRLKSLKASAANSWTFEQTMNPWPFHGSPGLVYIRKEGGKSLTLRGATLTVTSGLPDGSPTTTESWQLELSGLSTTLKSSGTSAVYLTRSLGS
jgi:hypothetical protein